MNKSLKGALMSALVFPGTGQVALGRRGRGYAIIAVSLAGMVVIVASVMEYVRAVVEHILIQGGGMSVSAITRAATRSISTSESLLLNILVWAMIVLWAFSIIDAWIIGKKDDALKGNNVPARTLSDFVRERLYLFIKHFKELNGNPHYIALGMAIGIFVSFTPTIPFHMVLGVMIAFILRGSKSAAAIGVWASNPVTIPVFYYTEFKMGCLVLGRSIPFNAKYESITSLLKLGWDVTLVMMAGGVVLGIVFGVITYFVTRRIARAVRDKKQAARGPYRRIQ